MRRGEDSGWGRDASTGAGDEPPPPGIDDTMIVFLLLTNEPL